LSGISLGPSNAQVVDPSQREMTRTIIIALKAAAVTISGVKMMRSISAFKLSWFAMLISAIAASAVYADEMGVHCKIDELAFDGDPDITHADYVIPSGGQPTLRFSARHNDRTAGSISVELKARGMMATGTAPVSKDSIVRLPKQKDSRVTSGDFTFSHFDPSGDVFAVGTVQFQTTNAHHGECSFRLKMDVVDFSHLLR
jgi:hypothetical protein